MSVQADKDFRDISIAVFTRLPGVVPFDIYIRRAENAYTKLFKKGDMLDQERINDYHSRKGIQALYVHEYDQAQYVLFVERIAKELFSKAAHAKSDDLLEMIKELTIMAMDGIVENSKINLTAVQYASETVQGCLVMLDKDPGALARIFKMIAAHEYSIRHALSTTIFSLLLAKALKMESPRTLTAVGLGALLHDIGMSLIPFEAEGRDDLTPDQWKQLKTHPQLGARILDSIRSVPEEARLIIMQHHEQPNGNGYPDHLIGSEIYPLAKVVAVADSFSALIAPRPFRTQALSVVQALDIMRSDQGKFDTKILDAFKGLILGRPAGN